MYESHFGLKSRPFGSKAEGTGVFVGPQQTTTMAGINKGLGAVDAVVTVIGPAGAGKTTIVERALEQISPGRTAARIGRMPLTPHEALELLFGGFGIKQQDKGTIRRFAAFRQLLAVQAAADAQVAIVIEDAERIGVDTLAELEAITAADTGDGTGANIILMGQAGLSKILQQPALARLNQRIRLRARINPLSEAETQGYLKHVIRQAGGDYDELFGSGVAEVVFSCSQGIPRVINTLCEMAMTSAAETGAAQISAALVHQVAVDAFGYEGPPPQEAAPATPAVASPDTAEPVPAADEPDIDWESLRPPIEATPPAARVESPATPAAPAPDKEMPVSKPGSDAALSEAAMNIVVESGRYPELPEETAEAPAEPAAVAAEPETRQADNNAAESKESAAAVVAESPQETVVEDADADPVDDEIPELINDTQPELSQLAVANVPQSEAAETPDPDAGSTAIQEKPAELDALLAAPGAGQNQEATEDFDLDAALTIDAGDTNLMQNVTPALDKLAAAELAAATKAPAPPAPAAPSLDDLPTLSDSMRVDVEAEVDKAKTAMADEETAESEPATPVKTAEPADPKPTTAKKAESADLKPAAENMPEPAAEDTPEPAAELVLEPDPEIAALPAGGPAEPDSPPEPEPAKPAPQPEMTRQPEVPSRPAPVAQVSEMTARIALIDPDKRAGDVDALEAALDAAKKGELDRLLEETAAPGFNNGVPAGNVESVEEMPAITLDEALADQVQQNEELDQFAAEIAKANSLEEFSDKMAETLFGNEDLDAIAADVVANPPQADPGTPAGEEPEPVAVTEQPDLEIEEPAPGHAPLLPGEDLRSSQAIKKEMMNELNGQPGTQATGNGELGNFDLGPGLDVSLAEKVELSSGPDVPAPKPKGPKPDSIEDQISTSMTQNLEALDVSKMADNVVDDEPAPKKSGGLFSRFRKSS